MAVTRLGLTATPTAAYAVFEVPVVPIEVEPIRVWHRQYYRRIYRGQSEVAVAAARADFTWQIVSGATVQFTNLSVGLISSLWNFDGTGSSTDRSPEHTFPTLPGDSDTYMVCLQINDQISLTTCKLVTIDRAFENLDVETLTHAEVESMTHAQVEAMWNNPGGP